jgi:hypothetical protein
MTCCCELLCRTYEGITVSDIHGDKTAYTLEAGMSTDFAVEREILVPLDIVKKMGFAVCFELPVSCKIETGTYAEGDSSLSGLRFEDDSVHSEE